MVSARVIVGMFTEVYHPVVNGVVASIDALQAGLLHDGVEVLTFAPRLAAAADLGDRLVRFPSVPLPTSTGYRVVIPYLRKRDRARLRSIDIAHAHSPFLSGWFAAVHARRAGIPLIYTYHTQFDAYAHYAPFEAHAARAALIALTRTFANRADIVIAPTHAMRDRLLGMNVVSRIEVVPSAIDAARFRGAVRSRAARALLGAGDRGRLVLLVARLGREKNVELAIDAMMYAASDVHLAIVGDGAHRSALVARARRRGLAARVTFAGRIAPAAMPELYAAADAFVFTSLTDTQGLVLLEAMAAGLPIVAVDSAVAREVAAPHAHVVPPLGAAVGAAMSLAASELRSEVAVARAVTASPAAQSRVMQHFYRTAQSAARLAL